jgi:uncharacterized metal-binding protein
MNQERRALPLVYSCSGCSSAAQMANYVAVKLDRRGAAEMSCIAGVGGDVPALLKLAHSGRRIIAIDGCPLACVKHSLERHGIEPDAYVQLAAHGVKKRFHADFEVEQAERVASEVEQTAQALTKRTTDADAIADGRLRASEASAREESISERFMRASP